MNRTVGLSSLLLLTTLAATSGCRPAAEEPPAPAREPLVRSPLLSGGAPASSAAPTGVFQGKVVETLEAGPYIYVHVDSGTKSSWAAAPEANVAVGDEVRFSTQMPMANYESKTLSRTFDVVYFTQSVERVGGAAARSPQTRPAADNLDHGRGAAGAAAGIDLSGIEVPEGGMTIAAVHERASELAETEVLVRGRVVKFTPAVMDHNWLHLQDGSGEGATADLTVITDGEAAIGDLITIQGTVAVDQNFGFGYEYAVLVRDALVTVE